MVFKAFFGLYVNSWGRGKTRKVTDRAGTRVPARFLCVTMKYPVSKVTEVTHTKASPLEHFGFIVATLNEAICPRDIH